MYKGRLALPHCLDRGFALLISLVQLLNVVQEPSLLRKEFGIGKLHLVGAMDVGLKNGEELPRQMM